MSALSSSIFIIAVSSSRGTGGDVVESVGQRIFVVREENLREFQICATGPIVSYHCLFEVSETLAI
jgi:hypothetical protein